MKFDEREREKNQIQQANRNGSVSNSRNPALFAGLGRHFGNEIRIDSIQQTQPAAAQDDYVIALETSNEFHNCLQHKIDGS